jgi:sugar/nucleoside kinase (ribokinase family)
MTKLQQLSKKFSPIAIGTGLLTLDVVFSDRLNDPLGLWAGGTFGNVMIALSYLGWDSYPIARLKKDKTAEYILDDLKNCNVHTDYIVQESSGTSPIIIEHIHHSQNGQVKHSFSFRCPCCKQRLPSYRPIPAKLAIPLVESLPQPQVFFFDRVSRAALDLAKYYAREGGVVFFEPISIGKPEHFQEALEISHIVKYSRDRLSEKDVIPRIDKAMLVIETMGDLGLRYLNRCGQSSGQKWVTLKPFHVRQVRDSAGSGDWCTAGLIHMLASQGLAGFESLHPKDLANAMQFSQALGAWNCMYEGARGGMYKVNKSDLHKIIDSITHGLDVEDVVLNSMVGELNKLTLNKSLCFPCIPSKERSSETCLI